MAAEGKAYQAHSVAESAGPPQTMGGTTNTVRLARDVVTDGSGQDARAIGGASSLRSYWFTAEGTPVPFPGANRRVHATSRLTGDLITARTKPLATVVVMLAPAAASAVATSA